jgi:hypothetical protein
VEWAIGEHDVYRDFLVGAVLCRAVYVSARQPAKDQMSSQMEVERPSLSTTVVSA